RSAHSSISSSMWRVLRHTAAGGHPWVRSNPSITERIWLSTTVSLAGGGEGEGRAGARPTAQKLCKILAEARSRASAPGQRDPGRRATAATRGGERGRDALLAAGSPANAVVPEQRVYWPLSSAAG